MKLIAIVKLWEQPPIETPARIYEVGRTFVSSCPIIDVYLWAVKLTSKYVKLVSVTIMTDEQEAD